MRRPIVLVAAITCALALGACGGDDDKSENAKSSTDGGISSASVDYGVKFTGGTAGKADPNLPPVTIGFVNQQGATPSYEQQEHAADAAVKFVNDHLGGIEGHPIELDKCFVQAEEDGQKCAAQLLANDEMKIALRGLQANGAGPLYKTVGGKIPFVISEGGAAPDFVTPHVYMLSGSSSEVLRALALQAQKNGDKKVAVVSSDNPAGKNATETLMLPLLKELNIEAKTIYVSDTATTPDFASALQAAGATSADSVLLIPAVVAQCISAYDAMKQLGMKQPVLATFTCYGDPMPEHSGGGPEGWQMFGFGTNQHVDNPETRVLSEAMAEVDKSNWTTVGSTYKTFGDVLNIVKWSNAIGYDKLSPKAYEEQILAWRGPNFMVPGDFACTKNPTALSTCGDSAEGSTYRDGKWESLGAVKATEFKQ